MTKEFKKINLIKRSLLFIFFLSAFHHSEAKTDVPPQKEKGHVVFLISEDPDNYEATTTVPVFAEKLRTEQGFKVTVIVGEGPRTAFHFPGLDVLSDADLLVVFCRRLALTNEQLTVIRNYLKAAKPVVGIRTANHAFSVREKVADGYEAWPEFVSDILGCENRGYGPEPLGTKVAIVPAAKKHPIVKGVVPLQWQGDGSTYLVAPLLDKKATVLFTGSVQDKVEPVAWTRYTSDKSRVFYTSLGYPTDFDRPQFVELLVNGIYWAMDLKNK
jgi:hypothetical protein